MILCNGKDDAAVLQVLSELDVTRIVSMLQRLHAAEAAAEAAEVAGDDTAADDAWVQAAVLEETLEGVWTEVVEEGGTAHGLATSEDEYEPEFGTSLHERLFRIGYAVCTRDGDSHYRMEFVDEWPNALNTRFLAHSDMADVVKAAGQEWRRTPLQMDDPRRPADAFTTCIDVRGRPTGPVNCIWTGEDGRIVGPLTLVDLGVRPARTRQQVAQARIADAVRMALRFCDDPTERWAQSDVEALSNDDAEEMARDAYYFVWHKHRDARRRESAGNAVEKVALWLRSAA